jgi:hypothetical protein
MKKTQCHLCDALHKVDSMWCVKRNKNGEQENLSMPDQNNWQQCLGSNKVEALCVHHEIRKFLRITRA